jgi:Sulfotransferase family
MPYSKSMKFIHIAIPKTGTTSLVRALKTAHKSSDGKLTLLNEKITPEFRSTHSLNELGDNKPGSAKHLSAIQLKHILGEHEFNRCFKFSIVRNPWARLVTRYFYTHSDFEPSNEEKLRRGTTRKFHSMKFEDWIVRYYKNGIRRRKQSSQLRKLVDLEGNLIVDYIGRLETFQESLNHICDKIKINRILVPHVNGTSSKRGHYSEFYNQRTRDIVEEACSEDIEFFGFQFEYK